MNDSHHASLEPQHCNQDTLTAGDRSSDALFRRLRDQEVALHISERIAAIRDQKELLRLIVQEIQPIFDFHDCGLFVVSRDGQTHQDLAAVMPEISPSEANYLLSEQAPPVVPHPGSLLEWMMAQIDQVGRPVLMDFRDLWEQDPDYPQFQIMRDWPFRDCLATNLRIGGQTFGLFCINATQKNHFKPQQFPLFQQIANQIAIAIANILANEELEQRAADLETSNAELRRHDALLLSITEATQCLLENDDLDTAIPQALKILGEGTQQDRVYIFENTVDEATGEILWVIPYEWNAPGIPADTASNYFPLPMNAFPSHLIDPIKNGQVVQFLRRDLDGIALELNEHGQAKSLVGVPITIKGQWWGVIGFDDCHTEKHWSESEIAVLKIAASSIGSAIERDRTRKAREDAERRILLEREQATRDRADYLEETNRILSLREQWLDATANAANALLSEPDLDTAINTAMRIIGETTGADRMGVMTFTPDPTGRSLGVFHETYEWDSPYATSQKDHPTLHAIPTDGLEDIVMQMMAGEWTGGLIDEFDEPFRSGQIELGVKSTYAVPIFVRDTLWGIVAIDHCREARRLTPAELAVFKTAASCVGSAIQQVQNRAAREEAERRILLEREQAAQEKAAHLEETNRILSLREQWLEAAANAANALLSESDLDAAIDNALRVIGESIDIDRVAVMRQIDDPTGETFGSIRMMHEWNSAYASPQILHPDLHEISWAGVEDWFVRQAQGDWLGGVVTELREPIRSGQIKLGVQSTYSVPIFVGDRFWGMLCIDHCREPKRLTTAEIAVLKTAATCIGSAIHQEQIRQSREAAEKAVLNERNRMARDIHDTLAQSFTGIIMQLEAARNALPASSEETQDRLRCASNIARHGLAEARQSVHALRSSALESCNLPTALQRLVRQMTEGTSVQVTVETEGQSYPLPAEVEDNLLRIGQEALTNALRHANPSQICIRLLYEEKMLHLSVSDNGRGFDPQESLYQSGFGIVGMQERSHLINGEFHLNSQPNAGTTITVSVRTR